MRRLLFLLFVVLLAGCAEVAPGDYYLVPAEDITPDYQHCEGVACWRVQLITQTPVPTTVPTNVVPTPEVTFVPEPTQETQPTPTPHPTEIPVDKNCYAGVKNSGLNIRVNHDVAAVKLGVYQAASRVPVTALFITHAEGSPNREEWAQVSYRGREGWIALWFGGAELARLDDSDFCFELPIEYAENPLPLSLGGFHTLAGEGAGVLAAPQYAGRYDTIKCLNGGFGLCDQAGGMNPNLITVCRSFMHDRVDPRYYSDPQGWWDVIKWAMPDHNCDYYEVQNEVDWPVETAALWANWNIQMAQIIERERGAALLAFSSGPGNPDLPWWRGMWAYVDWSKTHVAPNGYQHGIATHSSAFAPTDIYLPPGTWINNPYIADREKLVCEMALANHYGNGTGCQGVVWFNTELGVDDGYSGTKDVLDCVKKGRIYKETIRRKGLSALAVGIKVIGFHWWNIGKIGQWSSDHDCIPYMLQ